MAYKTAGRGDKAQGDPGAAGFSIDLNIGEDAAIEKAIDGAGHLSGFQGPMELYQQHVFQVTSVQRLLRRIEGDGLDNFAGKVLGEQDIGGTGEQENEEEGNAPGMQK
jgi:hypothetical protein